MVGLEPHSCQFFLSHGMVELLILQACSDLVPLVLNLVEGILKSGNAPGQLITSRAGVSKGLSFRAAQSAQGPRLYQRPTNLVVP